MTIRSRWLQPILPVRSLHQRFSPAKIIFRLLTNRLTLHGGSLIGDAVVKTANQRMAALPLNAEKESAMAGRNQSEPSLGLDRRQILAATALVTAVGIVPNAESAQAANAAQAVNAAKTPVSDIPPLNLCAATARRSR